MYDLRIYRTAADAQTDPADSIYEIFYENRAGFGPDHDTGTQLSAGDQTTPSPPPVAQFRAGEVSFLEPVRGVVSGLPDHFVWKLKVSDTENNSPQALTSGHPNGYSATCPTAGVTHFASTEAK